MEIGDELMETRFSQRLSRLMKERKISGQKIGDAVGKSQKTISRYATGEIEPTDEMKKTILRVIADISGIEDDASMGQEVDELDLYAELTEWITNNPDCGEMQIANELMAEMDRSYTNLTKVFRMLSKSAKQYYMEHFDMFHRIEEWENEVLYFFNNLPSYKKDELMTYLEKFDFDYSSLTNIDKISAYMKMINESKKSPLLIVDKEIDPDNLSEQEELLVEEFETKLYEIYLGNKEGTLPYYPWFLSYTSYDWYFLLRVQIFVLHDTDECLWIAAGSEETGIESAVVISRKLAFLLDSMK